MTRGISEYRHQQYEDAAGDLGGALPTEFNNPYLHYYMANCMVHMHHREAAIREYRIAYALQPEGQVGSYCKMCLDRFGIDAEGKKILTETIAKKEVKPGARIPDLPPSAAEIAALRANPRDGSETAWKREAAVSNLQDLMQSKQLPSGAPVPNPVGTNLYVRHYQKTHQKSATGTAQSSAQDASSPQSAASGSNNSNNPNPSAQTGSGAAGAPQAGTGAAQGASSQIQSNQAAAANASASRGMPKRKFELWWW